MNARSRSSARWMGALITVALILSLFASMPRSAAAANAWQLGQATQTTTYNCILQSDETLALNWAGYFGEPGVSPHVGEVYYVQALWGVTGDPCPSGEADVHVEFTLPQGTQLAIDTSHPVHCIKEDFNARTTVEDTADCPQAPQAGLRGGLAFDPPSSAMPGGLWTTERGFAWHIQVPVVSSQPLDGLETGSCASCLKVGLWEIEGNRDPWTFPQVGIPVLAGGGASPSPSPSTSPSPSPSPSPAPATHFADVPAGYWADTQIEQFAARGITTGCGTNSSGQRLYCPDRNVTRAEMAVFLDRALGSGNPPPPPTPTFADVPPTYWAYGYIERFAAQGITTGCGTNAQGQRLYCPDRNVTRAEMAVFLTRAFP